MRLLQNSTNIIIKRLILSVPGKEEGDLPFVPHILVKAEEPCRVVKLPLIDPKQHISIPQSDLFEKAARRNPGDP